MAGEASLPQLRALEEIRARQLRNIREKIARLEADQDPARALTEPTESAEDEVGH